MGKGVQVGKMKSSRDGWQGQLHSSGNVLNAPERAIETWFR